MKRSCETISQECQSSSKKTKMPPSRKRPTHKRNFKHDETSVMDTRPEGASDTSPVPKGVQRLKMVLIPEKINESGPENVDVSHKKATGLNLSSETVDTINRVIESNILDEELLGEGTSAKDVKEDRDTPMHKIDYPSPEEGEVDFDESAVRPSIEKDNASPSYTPERPPQRPPQRPFYAPLPAYNYSREIHQGRVAWWDNTLGKGQILEWKSDCAQVVHWWEVPLYGALVTGQLVWYQFDGDNRIINIGVKQCSEYVT